MRDIMFVFMFECIFCTLNTRLIVGLEEINMNEMVSVNKLIDIFTDMANRESLLARGGISQQDLLLQIIGTIVYVAMSEGEE